MMERWKNDDGSETILVTNDVVRPSLPRRILGFIGKTLLFLLVSIFPLYLLIKGFTGISTAKLSMWSRTRGIHTLYGHEAVGWSWIMIGFAIGSLPYAFRENLAGWMKWLLGLAATTCGGIGIWRLIQGN